MRVARLTVLAVALAMCLTGCSTPGGKDTLPEEELKVKVLDYLEERYGTYFQVVGIDRDSLFGGPAQGVSVIALDYPDCDEFTVYWTREWWQDTFDDRFLYCSMTENYRTMAEQAASAYFPENHTTVDFVSTRPEYPDSFNGNTAFEEFYQWGRSCIDIRTLITVPTTVVGDFEEEAAAIESSLQLAFPIGSLVLRVQTPLHYQMWIDFDSHAPDNADNNYEHRWDIPNEEFLFHEWEQ